LDDADRSALDALPPLFHDHAEEIAEVAVALEAKACMTEHIKSLPRLHAEVLATGYLAKERLASALPSPTRSSTLHRPSSRRAAKDSSTAIASPKMHSAS
jgi:hypothetical protein